VNHTLFVDLKELITLLESAILCDIESEYEGILSLYSPSLPSPSLPSSLPPSLSLFPSLSLSLSSSLHTTYPFGHSSS
jgi:hypothetical protein